MRFDVYTDSDKVEYRVYEDGRVVLRLPGKKPRVLGFIKDGQMWFSEVLGSNRMRMKELEGTTGFSSYLLDWVLPEHNIGSVALETETGVIYTTVEKLRATAIAKRKFGRFETQYFIRERDLR